MKHKLRIHAVPPSRDYDRNRKYYLWYVGCKCSWEPNVLAAASDGREWFGRDSWEKALALGLDHQRLKAIR